MGSFTRFREEILRLICARNEINVLIGLFRSLAIRSALQSLFWQRFFRCGALRALSRDRGRVWCRLRGGSRPACRSRGAGRRSRNSVPHRRRESIPGWPATAAQCARRCPCRTVGGVNEREWSGFPSYQPDLTFDLRGEGGWMDARLGITGHVDSNTQNARQLTASGRLRFSRDCSTPRQIIKQPRLEWVQRALLSAEEVGLCLALSLPFQRVAVKRVIWDGFAVRCE